MMLVLQQQLKDDYFDKILANVYIVTISNVDLKTEGKFYYKYKTEKTPNNYTEMQILKPRQYLCHILK